MEVVIYTLLGLAAVGAVAYALYQVTLRQRRLDAEITRLEQLTAEVTMNAEAVLEQVDQRVEKLNQLAAAMEARALEARQAPALAAPAKPSLAAAGTPPLDVLVGEAQVFTPIASGPASEVAAPVSEVTAEQAKGVTQRGRSTQAEAEPKAPATEVLAPPRKRGRSPKAAQSPAPQTAAAAMPTAQPATASAPKRRGRKPKAQSTPAITPTPSPSASAQSAELPASPDRYGGIREAVFARADRGEDAVAIAAALGVPRGEVMLLLNLRAKQPAG